MDWPVRGHYSLIGPLILLLMSMQGNSGNSDLMELDLEREILKNTNQFLENKLIICMKDVGSRERNKVN